MKPEELVVSFIYQHKWGKWLWQKGWICLRRNDSGKNFMLKELLEIFDKIERAKGKMLKAELNL